MKYLLVLIAALFVHEAAFAQQSRQSSPGVLNYNYAELRFVDVDDNGGDGFRLGGSIEINGPWILVGAITQLDYDFDVDTSLLEIGGGYVWNYTEDFDLVGTVRLAQFDVDTPLGDADDTGFALSGGTRGLLTPQFEVRGSVNHINFDDSDTYLELAGDYYFTEEFSAGVSLEFAGDTDSITFGARWYFR